MHSLKPPEAEVTFRLVPAGPPVRGRVLTLEGQPVAGATIRVGRVEAPDGKNTLKDVYAMWAGEAGQAASLLQRRLFTPVAGGLPETLTAGPDGRFEIANIGRDRLLMLEIAHDSIEHVHIRVAVDPNFDAKAVLPDRSKADPRRMYGRVGPPIYGPAFDHAARPCRPIVGTVRDKVTGKPLANVGLSAHAPPGAGWWEDSAYTRTDAYGNFRLLGMANVEGRLAFGGTGDPDWPYLAIEGSVKPTVGLSPATCDMVLVRGTIVAGRVVDMVTEKPIKGSVSYAPLLGNTAVFDLPGKDLHRSGAMSYPLDADGRYRLVAPPGLGIITVYVETRGTDQKPYPQVRLRAEDKGKPYFPVERGYGDAYLTADGALMSFGLRAAYRVIEPNANTGRMENDFRLHPGSAVAGTVVSPNGQPFAGATVAGTSPTYEEPKQVDGAAFTAQAVVPGEGRPVGALHVGQRLAGLTKVSANADESPVIRLAAWGAVTGRVIDADGKPVAGATVKLRYDNGAPNQLHHAATNDKARRPATTARSASTPRSRSRSG
ncbi:MAG: carboxypeptidase-like regulatory domain-containing protein [Gemmataceae bacterium]